MKYTLSNAKVVNIPDKDLEKLQNVLDISREEAIHTWLVDNDYEIDAEADELTEKAKKSGIMHTIHGAKAENSEKKERKPREKKENLLKREIIDSIFYYFSNKDNINFTIDEIKITNCEKYIDFTSNGRNFTINLVEHRPKK